MSSSLTFDEAVTLEKMLLIARRIEQEHETPLAKGHASDVAYGIERLCEICLPNSYRTNKRKG